MKPIPEFLLNLTDEQKIEIVKKAIVDPEIVKSAIVKIPPSWTLLQVTFQGAGFKRGNIQVMFTVQKYAEKIWLHVSAVGRTGPDKWYLPSYEELKRVKTDFIGDDKWAYQVFSPKRDHISFHDYVLHLYALLDGSPLLPDFTQGIGMI